MTERRRKHLLVQNNLHVYVNFQHKFVLMSNERK